MGDSEYLACWNKILIPITKEFKPDLIIVSAGFDCAKGDPLGQMNLSPEGYKLALF
jgi:histone deacetylase 6